MDQTEGLVCFKKKYKKLHFRMQNPAKIVKESELQKLGPLRLSLIDILIVIIQKNIHTVRTYMYKVSQSSFLIGKVVKSDFKLCRSRVLNNQTEIRKKQYRM